MDGVASAPRRESDDALAVRGGDPVIKILKRSAETTFLETGRYELSLWADTPEGGESKADLIVRLLRAVPIPHNKIQVFRVRSLRENGFAVHATPPEPYHVDVPLGEELSVDTLERFIASLEESIVNPIPQEERVT